MLQFINISTSLSNVLLKVAQMWKTTVLEKTLRVARSLALNNNCIESKCKANQKKKGSGKENVYKHIWVFSKTKALKSCKSRKDVK